MRGPVDVFIAYHPEDEDLHKELEKHLRMLQRQGVLRTWSSGQVGAGQDWRTVVGGHLDSAQVILLLLSASFFASDDCWDGEVERALARRSAGVRVIPIRLRAYDWGAVPFEHLRALPADGQPITPRADRDAAWAEIAAEIRRLVTQPGGITRAATLAGVPPRPFGFVERTALAKRLDDALRKGSAALVGVAGEGGVGKTTLAAEYARGFADSVGTVVWVDVRTAAGSTAGVAQELLGKLGAGTGPIASAEAGLLALLQVLEAKARDGRTLLVLDNADHPDADLGGFLDKLAEAPRTAVLVTTRDPAFAERLDAIGVDVGGLAPDEAVALLRSWLEDDPRASDAAGLRAVAEHERCVALWVGLAGGYLKRHGKLSPAEYVRGAGAFDRIWKDLPAEGQALFVAGGACGSTGFGVAAVAAAAAVEEGAAEAGLRQLLAKAMVTAVADGRWLLHPLLRERARAGAGFAEAAARHGDWVLAAVGTDRMNLESVEAVKDEVAAAVENAMVTDSGERLVRLSWHVEYFWRTRGPWGFADRALERAVDVARAAGYDDFP